MKALFCLLIAILSSSIGIVVLTDVDARAADALANLQIAGDEVLVRPTDIKSVDWNEVISEYIELSDTKPPAPFPQGFYHLYLRDGYSPESLLVKLIADDRFDFANPVYVYPGDKRMYMTDRLVIEYEPSNSSVIDNALLQYDLADRKDMRFGSAYYKIIRLKDGKDYNPATLSRVIDRTNLAISVYPDFYLPFEPLMTPNDDYYSEQYWLDRLDMPLVWDMTIPENSVLIYILDEGIESHEDFDSLRIAYRQNYFPGYPFKYASMEMFDTTTYNYHGMAVAGIIGATTNNGTGIASIAGRDGVRFFGQMMMYKNTTANVSATFASASDIARAIYDAIDSGVAIINICWGIWPLDNPNVEQGFCSIIGAALGWAYYDGVFIVAGAGNWCDDDPDACDELCFPANLYCCFSVGALNTADTITDFSQGGPDLDVVAYGDTIYTTDRMGDKGINSYNRSLAPDCPNSNYHCSFNGTSAAAPMVTATAALILQRRPDLIGDVYTLADIIRYSCENPYSDVEDTARISDEVGWGRVNPMRALLAVSRGDANNNGAVNVGDAVYINAYVFQSGPAPQPHILMGDANCDGYCNVGDVTFLINYIFRGGPAPSICYEYDNY